MEDVLHLIASNRRQTVAECNRLFDASLTQLPFARAVLALESMGYSFRQFRRDAKGACQAWTSLDDFETRLKARGPLAPFKAEFEKLVEVAREHGADEIGWMYI